MSGVFSKLRYRDTVELSTLKSSSNFEQCYVYKISKSKLLCLEVVFTFSLIRINTY